MMKDPSLALISVAMCTFQGETYVAAQLDSLQAQTWQNLEIIVVDDGSTDGTLDIVQQYALKDPRIKLFQNTHNLGINKNFSRAMALCQGEFIAPCDQDDVWHPEKLTRLHACLGSHLMAYCDSELIDTNGESLAMRISDRLHMAQGRNPLVFAFWNCISGHAMLFRRELLDSALPIPPLKFHDWWLAFWAACLSDIQYLDQPLVQYRQHAGGQTNLSRQGPQKKVENRSKLFRERREWFSYLAQVPHHHQAYVQKLALLYARQANQWLSWGLVRHLHQEADALLFINKKKSFFRFAFKHFWGLKAKRFFNPANYPRD